VIPSLWLLATLGAPAFADEPEPDEDPLSEHRAPFDVLVERSIGSTSVPVEFNWRRSKVHLGVLGSHPYELNNFDSLRSGLLARFPSEGLIYEASVSYVWVWDTPASEQLALTPYRQPGKPKRLELDFTMGLPLAEGVVTAFPRWFPAVELVFSTYVGLRYALYPFTYDGLTAREVTAAVLSPTLTETEIEQLELRRLDAMQVDSGRYGLMTGFGNDLYFRQGLFVSPRVMLAVPLLAPATLTDLRWWADLSLSIGVAL